MWMDRTLFWAIVGALGLTLQALFAILLEKKDIKKVAKGLVTYPIFLLSWLCLNLLAHFNLNIEWKPIEHVKVVDIKDM